MKKDSPKFRLIAAANFNGLAAALVSWYQTVQRDLPWRRFWRTHQNPYHVWVSEIMLQQTVIAAVTPKYLRFIEELPDVENFAAASEEKIRTLVGGLGYYRRFAAMHAAAKKLVDENRQWPKNQVEWMELPGIGPYTSAAIASITLNEPVAAIDGNAERVFCRLHDIRLPPNLPALKKEFIHFANQIIDRKNPGDFNQAVMELGQTICTPTSPRCGECPVKNWCQSFAVSSQHLAPQKKLRQMGAIKDLHMRIVVVTSTDGVLIIQRDQQSKFLKNQIGLPAYVQTQKKWIPNGHQNFLQTQSTPPAVIGQFRHTITNHRIKVEVCHADWKEQPLPQNAAFHDFSSARKSMIASLDQKAWDIFINLGTPTLLK